jgi:integrating conjugative element protein (TIGR03761 family)
LEVPTSEGRKINLIGSLIGGEDDTMTLHTVEAARLYNGFTPSSDSVGRYFVPGARRAAIALRQLFLMTALDNPYADYLLVQIDERVAVLNKEIAALEKVHISKLDDQKKKGLSYSILETRTPQVLTLGYKSPYGYMLSGLVVNFDYLVRVLKSAERRDLCTKRDVAVALSNFKHSLRSMFMLAIEGARSLSHESLAGLSRSDWLPQSSEVSVKRVALALDAFKAVPQSIFLGALEPRHSIRRYSMSGQDKQLLAATIAKTNAEVALAEKAGNVTVTGAANESGLAD